MSSTRAPRTSKTGALVLVSAGLCWVWLAPIRYAITTRSGFASGFWGVVSLHQLEECSHVLAAQAPQKRPQIPHTPCLISGVRRKVTAARPTLARRF